MRWDMICLDIDGTLLTDDKILLPEVKEQLKLEAEKGTHIVLASGRMPSGVTKIEKELGIPCIKICSAGTYSIMGEQVLSSRHCSLQRLKDVYNYLKEHHPVPLWIFRGTEWYVTATDDFVEKEIGFVDYTPILVDAEELIQTWDEEGVGPNKMLIAAGPEQITQINEALREKAWDDIDMARSADFFLEIYPKGVDKGKALSEVMKAMNIEKENVVAFGDQELDIPLILTAGTGVAMGNAIPELKKLAKYETKTNNNAGVAYALKNFLK